LKGRIGKMCSFSIPLALFFVFDSKTRKTSTRKSFSEITVPLPPVSIRTILGKCDRKILLIIVKINIKKVGIEFRVLEENRRVRHFQVEEKGVFLKNENL
jgi:hypothetical protein